MNRITYVIALSLSVTSLSILADVARGADDPWERALHYALLGDDAGSSFVRLKDRKNCVVERHQWSETKLRTVVSTFFLNRIIPDDITLSWVNMVGIPSWRASSERLVDIKISGREIILHNHDPDIKVIGTTLRIWGNREKAARAWKRVYQVCRGASPDF